MRIVIYNARMTRWLIALLVCLPGLAFANCEADLLTEFSRTPEATPNGFVTRNIPVNSDSLIEAYARGLFVWSLAPDGNGEWFSPRKRGVLFLDKVSIPRSDQKAIRRVQNSGRYQFKINSDFNQVITECANQPRFNFNEELGVLEPVGNWITQMHIDEYTKLHKAGLAHSLEVWEGDELVGGMYGVFVNGYFSGESMFHKRDDVTKVLYAMLIDRLKNNGHVFIDTQQKKGLNKKWGGDEITREEFHQLLEEAREANRSF